jgi:uncharacterized protein (DUF2147 family)
MIKIFFLSFLTVVAVLKAVAQGNADDITGRWMSAENNMEIEIFKVNTEYKAKVVWIDDSNDRSRPMNTRTDWKNPDETLRKRKIIGLVVMCDLVYNKENNDWEDGHIYDPNSGKDWKAKAWITKDGHLKIRGYWDLQVFGKDILFKKVL